VSARKHLTPVELAERLDLKPATLAMWRVLGKGPKFVKFGTSQQARVRYPEAEVLAWESAQPHLANTSQASAA
jgi:hypothetical protein